MYVWWWNTVECGCMVLTLECGLRYFYVDEQCWLWQWSYGTLIMRYIMMMLARYVIDLLRHTSSTCSFGCLVFA
jgi:hypothetical protein